MPQNPRKKTKMPGRGGRRADKQTVSGDAIMRLLTVSSLHWKRYLEHRLPSDITLKQMYLLRQLKKREYLYPSRIAEMLFADRPTATVIINNMKKKGWVTKEVDPDNQKMRRIIITKKGLERLASLHKRERMLADRFDPVECFTKKEQKELGVLLEKLKSHLETITFL